MSPKFNKKDYNFVAKRFRESFPTNYDVSTKQDVMLTRHILSLLMLDFAEAYLRDDPEFDPLWFLDQCSPDADIYPLSELWGLG